MPFIGASALAIATIRPGTRGAVGGRNTSSTPSGITSIRSGSTWKSRAMSRREDSETVRIRPSCRATLPCMDRKPYQRQRLSFLRSVGAFAMSILRSKVIGWWMVVTSGSPMRSMSRIPWPSAWLSCTTSKSPARSRNSRATRLLNVRGSGKPAVHIVSTSCTSIRSRNSEGRGVRNGSGSRYRSRLGTLVRVTPGSRCGYGCPEKTSTSWPSAVSSRLRCRT